MHPYRAERAERLVDFLAPAGKLVVEIEGPYHQRTRTADARRERKLVRLGYRAYSGASDQSFRPDSISVPKDPIRFGAKRRGRGGSGGGLGIGLGFQTFPAAHRGAVQRDDVSVVHEPVADGVGDSRIAESLVPTFRRQL